MVFILVGLLVGLAFMIEWMERRNLAEIGLNRLVLSSFLLPVGLFCYAASAMLHGRRHQPIWIALCVATLSFVLVTGTRTGLIMLVAPVWITATMPGPLGRRLGRLAIILASGVALAAGATIGAAVFTKADTTQLTQRFTSIETFFRDPGQDNSYLERVEQTKVLLRAFRADPIWGTGPGYVHYWRRYSDVWVDGFNLDTGAAFPTKFGLVGVFVMVVIAGACVAFLRRLRRIPGTEVEGDGLASYLVILGLWFLFGPPFEDKGTSFALVCLFTLCLLRLRGAEGEQRGVPAWMRA
ncbi:MAG: O-antigen ligase family protein [Dehalococcoidia bacterium]